MWISNVQENQNSGFPKDLLGLVFLAQRINKNWGIQWANSFCLPMYAVVRQTRTKKMQTLHGNDWQVKSRGLMHVHGVWRCTGISAHQWLQGLQEQPLVLITQDIQVLKIGLFHRRKMWLWFNNSWYISARHLAR